MRSGLGQRHERRQLDWSLVSWVTQQGWAAGPAARRRRWLQALQQRLMASASPMFRNWPERIGERRLCHTAALWQRG